MTDFGDLSKQILNLQKSIDELAAVQRSALLPSDGLFSFIHDDKEVRLFLPNAAHDFIQKTILRTASFYEAALLRRARQIIKPGSTIIDAGANIGNHALYFSMFCKARAIHSFEPQNYAFSLLDRNMAANGIRNVVRYNAALGATPTRADITMHQGINFGATTFGFNDTGEYEVRTIDGLELDTVDFIKIDVEGAQMAVLQGARRTVEKYRPAIWCELREGKDDGDGTVEYMEEYGYERQQISVHDTLFLPKHR